MERVSGGLWWGLRESADMIKLQHTVFALPFALIALVSASEGWPEMRVWLWVLAAMVSARTAAMTFNRLVDQRIDLENPRTRRRALPAGRLSRRFAWVVALASASLFLVAAARLNRSCLVLAPVALAVLLGYSFSKRFTVLSHLWLGAALGLAPAGAWLAVSGSPAWPPVILAAAVALWVAGFDIIYSLQDEAFDRERGLHSFPARFGGRQALRLSRCFHALAVIGFAGFAVAAGGGPLRLLAVLLAGALLVWQHGAVSADDLSRVDAAFFTANGVLSIVMGVLFLFAKMLSGP